MPAAIRACFAEAWPDPCSPALLDHLTELALARDGAGVREDALELMPKSDVADAILDRVEGLLGDR